MPPIARKVCTPGTGINRRDDRKEKKDKEKKDKEKKDKENKDKEKKDRKKKDAKKKDTRKKDNKKKNTKKKDKIKKLEDVKNERNSRKVGRKKKVGRPKRLKRLGRKGSKLRVSYDEDDMSEAIRLVLEDGVSIKGAAKAINNRKKKAVPRSTLQGRLSQEQPQRTPGLGRPVELSEDVERALVKCLKMCAEFLYPMRPGDLQALLSKYQKNLTHFCACNRLKKQYKHQ